jgi:integrase/recombinase XerC
MRYRQLGLLWPEGERVESYDPFVEREIARWLDDERWDEAARATRRTTRLQIELFRKWLAKHNVTDVRDITRDVFGAYLDDAREAGFKASTVALKAWVVRSWLTWLYDEGRITRVPRVRTPKFEPPPIQVPTVEQIDAVIRACEDGTPQGFRDRALVLLLYGSGCRVGEASRLDLDDLDLAAATAYVARGKGERARTIWLTERAVAALREYVDRYRLPVSAPRHVRAVFTSRVGTRLTADMMRLAVRKRASSVGLSIHPHLFRHAVATHMLSEGGELRHVQAMLGHKQITSTQRYTHPSAGEIRATVERFHPHARG